MELHGKQEETGEKFGLSETHTLLSTPAEDDNDGVDNGSDGTSSTPHSTPKQGKDLVCVSGLNCRDDEEHFYENVGAIDTSSKKQEKILDPSVCNGTHKQEAQGKEGEVFEVASEMSFLRDANLTSSPSSSFKSSYAKSLADSYRRASIPIVVSASKGQFILKDDEVISLKMSQVKPSEFNSEKFYSLNGNKMTNIAAQNIELPLSLPPTFDSGTGLKKQGKSGDDKSGLAFPIEAVYDKLLGGDVFVAFDELSSLCESSGSSFSLQDWHSLGCIVTNDGRKLINLSDLKTKWKQEQMGPMENGHTTLNGVHKTSQSDVERSVDESKGSVERLCEMLAHRDTTIQRLEEDLLRIRMECQRLMVDNRSMKSSLSHNTTLHSLPADSNAEVTRLQQQVDLLNAQLNKAERSRHTYEAATRQLVDFLHTVNNTLHFTASPSTSPSASFHSSSTPQDEDKPDDASYRSTQQQRHQTLPDDPPTVLHKLGNPRATNSEDDPSFRSIQDHYPQYSQSPPPALDLAHPTILPSPVRRNSDSLRKSGSVWALPTHTTQTRRVSRAASTHCVASAVSLAPSTTPSRPKAPTSTTPDKGRSPASEFLATRAKDLIASLRSLMRSDSILKLSLEPKKSGSVSSGRSQSSGRSLRSEDSPATDSSSSNRSVRKDRRRRDHEGYYGQTRWFVDDIDNGTYANQSLPPSEHEDSIQLPVRKVDSQASSSENEVSQVEVNFSTTHMSDQPTVPRIGTGPTREDIMQKSSAIDASSNPQPLSLVVLGEARPPSTSSSSTHQRFSSLPSHPPRSSSRPSQDTELHLVWV
ncbi:hypothetical protein Pmani_025066 [Petrolisthes manimaculis]|uniref:Uncharacterized protein n=1 Tax=Petrolisthes manimaculis TaxID=1843537 RepID=A0AAE1TZB9_9EUCA|nr:hypothetical protein Pmani_025066 [Petrolisthes manimaculis]